ncbi:hypothetical protein [Actinophytocola sp.]|uniref:hypothetical protein n=1 Tax=Actinophytocola sp. TaxID=1872138 RepID=UPI002ED2A340
MMLSRLGSGGDADLVRRWLSALSERVGVPDEIIVRYHAELVTFCRARAITPAVLLRTWQDFPELTVRRRPDACEEPRLGLESFLIHNGVNIFGDLVCLPGCPEDLRAQGTRFLPDQP